MRGYIASKNTLVCFFRLLTFHLINYFFFCIHCNIPEFKWCVLQKSVFRLNKDSIEIFCKPFASYLLAPMNAHHAWNGTKCSTTWVMFLYNMKYNFCIRTITQGISSKAVKQIKESPRFHRLFVQIRACKAKWQ